MFENQYRRLGKEEFDEMIRRTSKPIAEGQSNGRNYNRWAGNVFSKVQRRFFGRDEAIRAGVVEGMGKE